MAKQLSRFNKFQNEVFFSNLHLAFIGSEDWVDFESKKAKGIKIKVIIKTDNNSYGKNEKEENVTGINQGEVLTVKLLETFKQPDFKMFEPVKIIEPDAQIYGDFNNQLSITAKDVVVVAQAQKGA